MRTEIFIALALVVGSPSIAEAQICRSAVEAELKKYGDVADRVSVTQPESRFLGSNEGVRVGYKFWLRIKGCSKGYLIVDTDLDCNVEQIFTDGPCKISGVPDY